MAWNFGFYRMMVADGLEVLFIEIWRGHVARSCNLFFKMLYIIWENSSHFYFLVYHSSIEDVMFFLKTTLVRTYAWVCWRFIGQTLTNMTCLTPESSRCVAQAMGLILSFWRRRWHFWNDPGKLYVDNRQLAWLLSILLSLSWVLTFTYDTRLDVPPQKK